MKPQDNERYVQIEFSLHSFIINKERRRERRVWISKVSSTCSSTLQSIQHVLEVDVCYGGVFGETFSSRAEMVGTARRVSLNHPLRSIHHIIHTHTGTEWRVIMSIGIVMWTYQESYLEQIWRHDVWNWKRMHFVFGGDAVDWGVGDLRFGLSWSSCTRSIRVECILCLEIGISKLRLPRVETSTLRPILETIESTVLDQRSGKHRTSACGRSDNVSTTTMDSTIHDGCTEGIWVSKRELSLMNEEQKISDRCGQEFSQGNQSRWIASKTARVRKARCDYGQYSLRSWWCSQGKLRLASELEWRSMYVV